jgi:hypothetical protein
VQRRAARLERHAGGVGHGEGSRAGRQLADDAVGGELLGRTEGGVAVLDAHAGGRKGVRGAGHTGALEAAGSVYPTAVVPSGAAARNGGAGSVATAPGARSSRVWPAKVVRPAGATFVRTWVGSFCSSPLSCFAHATVVRPVRATIAARRAIPSWRPTVCSPPGPPLTEPIRASTVRVRPGEDDVVQRSPFADLRFPFSRWR